MQTDDERTATLDAELGRELGVFDEMLLREQERIRAAAAGTGTGESGSGGGGTGNGEGGDGENGDGKDSGEQVAGQDKTSVAESVKGDQQPDKSQGSLGKTHQPAAKDTPADIPDGSDDDLVARQLREAAEKERDPELKKRLWDEYRKYKKGTR